MTAHCQTGETQTKSSMIQTLLLLLWYALLLLITQCKVHHHLAESCKLGCLQEVTMPVCLQGTAMWIVICRSCLTLSYANYLFADYCVACKFSVFSLFSLDECINLSALLMKLCTLSAHCAVKTLPRSFVGATCSFSVILASDLIKRHTLRHSATGGRIHVLHGNKQDANAHVPHTAGCASQPHLLPSCNITLRFPRLQASSGLVKVPSDCTCREGGAEESTPGEGVQILGGFVKSVTYLYC